MRHNNNNFDENNFNREINSLYNMCGDVLGIVCLVIMRNMEEKYEKWILLSYLMKFLMSKRFYLGTKLLF